MRSERGPKRAWGLSLALLVAGLVLQGSTWAEEDRSSRAEYEVKAAFVYNFVKFVEWPDAGGPAADRLRLCVLGNVADALPFAKLAGAFAQGRKLAVLTLKERDSAGDCDVLFVAANQTGRLAEIIGALEDRPVLTIGDTDGYAERGIMINMFLDRKRVRFEINEKVARAAGIRISTKLLKLASKVYDRGTSGEE